MELRIGHLVLWQSGIERAIELAREFIGTPIDPEKPEGARYSGAVFGKMAIFLLLFAHGMKLVYHMKLPVPKIGPGPKGGFDLLWKTPEYKLLINVPADGPITYYGKNILEVEGSLDGVQYDFLFNMSAIFGDMIRI